MKKQDEKEKRSPYRRNSQQHCSGCILPERHSKNSHDTHGTALCNLVFNLERERSKCLIVKELNLLPNGFHVFQPQHVLLSSTAHATFIGTVVLCHLMFSFLPPHWAWPLGATAHLPFLKGMAGEAAGIPQGEASRDPKALEERSAGARTEVGGKKTSNNVQVFPRFEIKFQGIGGSCLFQPCKQSSGSPNPARLADKEGSISNDLQKCCVVEMRRQCSVSPKRRR
jgi:hypothetical protein